MTGKQECTANPQEHDYGEEQEKEKEAQAVPQEGECRKRSCASEATMASKEAACSGAEPFTRLTNEVEWTPKDTSRVYIVRFTNEKATTCSAWGDYEDQWPILSLRDTTRDPSEWKEDELYVNFSIIGGVWRKETAELIAVWGQNHEDGHVDFFGWNEYAHCAEDLSDLTYVLCKQFCPPMCDVFDDGSGITRKVLLSDASKILASTFLTNFYKVMDGDDLVKKVEDTPM